MGGAKATWGLGSIWSIYNGLYFHTCFVGGTGSVGRVQLYARHGQLCGKFWFHTQSRSATPAGGPHSQVLQCLGCCPQPLDLCFIIDASKGLTWCCIPLFFCYGLLSRVTAAALGLGCWGSPIVH